jgi:hypothetical protein
MTGKHPDSPSDRSLSDEVNPQTREAMDELGRADLEEAPSGADREQQDDSKPGQNSDWLPE